MKLTELTQLLADTKNDCYVLEGTRKGKKVVVSPSLVGRVMGTSLRGDSGTILGWINQAAIERGPVDPVFNNYGGEERFWFAPESGQFGLNLRGHLTGWENYEVPEAFTKQPFKALRSEGGSIVMNSLMRFKNAPGTSFALEVTRTIRVLDACPYALEHGDQIDCVAFESDNLVQNVDSKPIRRETGAPAMFCLTQFLEHPRLVAIAPFRKGPVEELGPPLRDSFKDFCTNTNGIMPPHRWRMLDGVAFFKADGKVRTKVGIGRPRATTRLGSLDLDSNELIIMDYDFYPELDYAAGYWRVMENPYDGDVASVSIQGYEQGGLLGESYELENLSPALFLHPGEYFVHRNRVFHLFGPQQVIDQICQKYLGASRQALEEFEAQSD